MLSWPGAIRDLFGLCVLVRAFRVPDHGGFPAIQFDDEETSMRLSCLVVTGFDPVNNRVRREATILFYPAPFNDVIGLVRESSVGRFHRCRIKIDRLFAEFDVNPAALIAANEFEFVTSE